MSGEEWTSEESGNGTSLDGGRGPSLDGLRVDTVADDNCAICFESLSSDGPCDIDFDAIQTLPCSHSYHVKCVERLRSFGISVSSTKKVPCYS